MSGPDGTGEDRGIDPHTGREPDDIRRSNDELAGGMGVSSEREGRTGPGQHGTDGGRYTGPTDPVGEVPPEQSAGGEETNPDPVDVKAGYPSKDPRSQDHPFEPRG